MTGVRPGYAALCLALVVSVLAVAPTATAAVTATVAGGRLEATGADGAEAIAVTCVGEIAKVNGVDPAGGPVACADVVSISIAGGPGDDTLDLSGVGAAFSGLTSNPSADGDEGDDTLTPAAVPSALIGGDGQDEVVSRADTDIVVADDTLVDVAIHSLGEIEAATLTGGSSDNTLDASGFTGTATLWGLGGNDTLVGSQASSRLAGGAGNDALDGSWGFDTAVASIAGNATITDAQMVGEGTDLLLGIEGIDVSGSSAANLIDASGFGAGVPGAETTIRGGGGNDTLIGGPAIDTVLGEGGDDRLTVGVNGQGQSADGGDGTDVLVDSGAGEATLSGGEFFRFEGTDVFVTAELVSIEVAELTGGAAADRIDASAFPGRSSLSGGGGHDVLTGGVANDTLAGGDGNDTLDGGAGNDKMLGGAGNDVMRGRAGDDYFEGGAGNDTIDGAAGVDRALFRVKVSVNLGSGSANGEGSDRLASIENVTGSSAADTIVGSAAANVLDGGGGNDVLKGVNGNDRLNGGAGNDTLEGGSGTDRCDGGPGRDTAGSCETRISIP